MRAGSKGLAWKLLCPHLSLLCPHSELDAAHGCSGRLFSTKALVCDTPTHLSCDFHHNYTEMAPTDPVFKLHLRSSSLCSDPKPGPSAPGAQGRPARGLRALVRMSQISRGERLYWPTCKREQRGRKL